MYKIVEKEMLGPNIFSMDILAPRVAKAALPGQFIIVIVEEKGERIPLTITNYNREEGTVQIVVQASGGSTQKLMEMEEGDSVYSFLGPLGKPSQYVDMPEDELKNEKLIFVAGGIGTAPIFPQVRWLSHRGADVDVIIGAQTKDRVILEERLKEYAKNVYVTTDDGSYGRKGLVTQCLKDLVEEEGKEYTHCVAIGPMVMMKFTAMLTKELGIPTTVSMNPIMVDGTGMCGACRITVDEETKFACVDGPEFDGHKIDFEEAMHRQTQYVTHECKCSKEGE